MVLYIFTLIAASMAARERADRIDSDAINELVVGACRLGWHRIIKEI